MTSRYVHSAEPSHGRGASAARRRYRFKSYMDANTMERARFESMKQEVSSKIEEVMASFRDDKLVVQPRHEGPVSRGFVYQASETGETVAPVAPPRRNWGPWALAAALALAVVWLIWQDQGGDVPETPLAVPGASFPAEAPQSVAPAVPAEPVGTLPAPAASEAAPTLSETLSLEPPPATVQEAPAPDMPATQNAEAARASKSRPKNRPPTPAAPEHYSEDLTGLLRGQR